MLYLIGPDGLVNLSFEIFQKNGVDDNGTQTKNFFLQTAHHSFWEIYMPSIYNVCR